jgi:hypothetical protein
VVGLGSHPSFLYPPVLGGACFRSSDIEALAVALSLTSLLGVRAPGYSCRKSTIVDMSAGAAAGGAACMSVGARSMRNYLKFPLVLLHRNNFI